MARCEACGEHSSMPYSCSYCGGTFCKSHRMPEKHGCRNLSEASSPSTANLTEENMQAASKAYRQTGNQSRRIVYLYLLVAAIVIVAILFFFL
ncbi:AN1-type zinc finger domain-containing protein [Natrialba asiatica]|uniref:AN1-type zinc finger domain-containing protein n=1 Tax=Natrialba asiatica TaxID=64602 RepID=UPI000A014443|nr:AN1-type zinc finger domain-containing protein [Natrialba asiatica]